MTEVAIRAEVTKTLIEDAIQTMTLLAGSDSPMFRGGLRGALRAMVAIGRLNVLEEFDDVCKADAFVGFSDVEWAAVQKFFAVNKEISGWDK